MTDHKPPSPEELDTWEYNARRHQVNSFDMLALIAEVRRLRSAEGIDFPAALFQIQNLQIENELLRTGKAHWLNRLGATCVLDVVKELVELRQSTGRLVYENARLKEEMEQHKTAFQNLYDRYKRKARRLAEANRKSLGEENIRLREALTFYGDGGCDFGETARKTLGEET